MTTRTRDTRPEPTVRPPRSRAAARLGQGALLPFIIGVFAAAICVAAHRYALAAAAAGTGSAIAAPFLLAAALVQARQLRLNPWPLIIAAGLLATGVTWRVLPVIGMGWARYPLLALAAWQVWRGGRAWVRYHRRVDAYRRLAQVMSQVVSQSAGQQEQVLAGLTGAGRAERVTAPHYGAAPNAAWNLSVTRWNDDQIAKWALKLPAHDDITTPDFLAHITDALERRLGLHVRLHVDPRRDEITGDVTDGSEDQADPATLRERAADRVKIAAGMLLKGVKVEHLDIDEEAAVPGGDGIAGVGHALREISISFDPAKIVTLEDNRAKITQHMSTQLFGGPDRLRDDWHVDQDRVNFRRRREFPALIPAPALTRDQLREMFGDRVVLAYGEDEDGQALGYPLNKTTLPHGMVIGPTGGGKTQLLLLIAMRAAQLGVETWGADPKMIELMGLRGWPNVPRVATKVRDMVNLVGEFHTEMYKRFDDISSGKKRLGDFRRMLLILDEYFVFCMLVTAWWAANPERTKEDPKQHPVFGQIAELLALSRGADMNLVIGIQRPDATFFNDGARDNIGWRVSLGALSPQGANMVWGDYHTGTELPLDVPGLCTATTPAGPARGKVHYVPNPAHALTGTLSDDDMAHLRALLPAGATWDGPLAADAPDPGFEDSAAAEEAIAADPVEGFLLLLRMALSSRTAHLTAAPGGGQPDSDDPARYGWGPGPGGLPEPGGTFIGSVEQTKSGRRVYLYPEHAYDIAVAFAAELTEPFGLDRKQMEDALRKSGLLATEGTKDEPRYTVRRNLPDSGLAGDPRKRVWDIPEDALLSGGRTPVPAARPSAPPPAAAAGGQPHPAPAPRPAPPAPPQPAPAPVRFRNAGDLTDGVRIILAFDDGEVLAATVFGDPEDDPTAAEQPEPDSTPRVVLNYIDDNHAPGWVRARTDHPIRLEQPGAAEGRQS
jgi:hypothetical protein